VAIVAIAIRLPITAIKSLNRIWYLPGHGIEHSVASNDVILSSAALSLWTGEGMARILARQNARVNLNCGTSIRGAQCYHRQPEKA